MVDIASLATEQERMEALMRSLTNQPPVHDEIIGRFVVIREAAKQLGREILIFAPHSAERTIAVRKLEETVMWAVKSIAVHQAEVLNAEGIHAGCHEIPATDFSDRAWEIQSDCRLPHPVE